MGDFRASIQIKFEMGDVKKETDMWINWSHYDSECSGVDQRIIDWFRHWAEIGESGIRDKIYDSIEAQNKEAEELQEKAEYARLHQKYGGYNQ